MRNVFTAVALGGALIGSAPVFSMREWGLFGADACPSRGAAQCFSQLDTSGGLDADQEIGMKLQAERIYQCDRPKMHNLPSTSLSEGEVSSH